MKYPKLLSLAIALASFGPPAVEAATITVTTTVDQIVDDAECSLREAIRASNLDQAFSGCFTSGSGADVVILPVGTYYLTLIGDQENNNNTGDLDVLDDLTIRAGGPGLSTIDATGLGDRVLDVPDADTSLTLIGIHVTGGASQGHGGGLWARHGLTLIESIVSGNSTEMRGGGIFAPDTGPGLRLISSTVSGNQATMDAGGVWVGMLYLANSTIEGNIAGGQGGGIAWRVDAANLSRIVNATISGNRSGEHGGGLFYDGQGILDLYSTTITDNEADEDGSDDGNGGGLYVAGGTVRMSHTILGANLDSSTGTFAQILPDCAGSLQSEGYNLIGALTGFCSITGTTTGNQTGTVSMPLDPVLAPLALAGGFTMVHVPDSSSPVLDAGDPGGCLHPAGGFLSMDQRGHVRPWDGPDADPDVICDIGSVELLAPDGRVFDDGFETGDSSRWSSP